MRFERTRLIRRRVIAVALALFVAVWLLIAITLASGHDPALAKSTRQLASSSSATTTSSQSTSSPAASTSSGSPSSSSSAAASAPSPVTTSQS
jgi:cytoskeletal protein RodZ